LTNIYAFFNTGASKTKMLKNQKENFNTFLKSDLFRYFDLKTKRTETTQ